MRLKNKSNLYKQILVLVGLIALSILQTGFLWLGDNTSLSFFVQEEESEMTLFFPQKIWLNTGAPYPLGYLLPDETKEYKKIVETVSKALITADETGDFEVTNTIDWKELLSKKGLVYEYTAGIGLEEILGLKNNLLQDVGIDTVSFYLKDGSSTELEVALLNTLQDKGYHTTVKGDFSLIKKLYETFNTQEVLDNMVKYQPSSTVVNMNHFIKGNVFLPLTGMDNPIVYEKLRLINPIVGSTEEQIELLEERINGFFINPLLKNVEITEDGGFLFTESRRAIVIYQPQGTLEYINLEAGSTPNRTMTCLEGYTQAIALVQEINEQLINDEEKFYLAEVKPEKTGYRYYFDSTYNAYKVNWSTGLQEVLDLPHRISIYVDNGVIQQAKWTVLELALYEMSGKTVTGRLETGYMEPINAIYAQFNKENVADKTLENVEQVYVIEDLEKPVTLHWALNRKGIWYYP